MEVAIIAGVTFAGWILNRQGMSPPVSKPLEPIQIIRDDRAAPGDRRDQATREILKYNEGAIKRFTQSKFPERSGIIAPFFRDVRSQASNEAMKQRRMESITGMDSVWKPKREQESLFQPVPQDIDSSGRSGNTIRYDSDIYRQSLSSVQSGTFPFERVNVGRGLGIDADQPAADNFHPMLRIIPPSGDLHKHHEMAGRVSTTGATYIQEMPVNPAIAHNRPPRVWTQERYPMQKGRSTATAPKHRSEHTSVLPPCHLVGEHWVGTAYREGGMPARNTSTREGDRTRTIDAANLTGPRAAGSYIGANFDEGKFESLDREAPGQILGVKYYNPSITKYSQDMPRDTIRDITGVRTVGPGNVEPVVKKQQEYCTGLQLLKEAKRGSYSETVHTAGPQRTTAYRQANLGLDTDPYVRREYKLRCQLQQRPSQTHINSSASRYTSTTGHVGEFATTGKKNPGYDNPRNDFQLASRVLENNPYVVK